MDGEWKRFEKRDEKDVLYRERMIFRVFQVPLSVSLILLSTLSYAGIPNISDLSLDKKIGQLIMIATVSAPELNERFMQTQPYHLNHVHARHMIQEYHVGGVIFLGVGTPDQQVSVTKQLQAISQYPLFIGLDAEWGLSMRHQNNVIQFPHAMTLGALAPENDDLIYECGKEIARQCKALGVHINFAPVADINNNPNNPIINTRSFAEDPEKVGHKASLFMMGMQDGGIFACAKHFPGHGDTDIDSHHKYAALSHSKDRLESVELVPFKRVINDGISAIMTAHLAVPILSSDENAPATLSHSIVTDLLRRKLGFKGLTVTDGLGMKSITDNCAPGECEVKALHAGNDILLCPIDIPCTVAAIKDAVTKGIITEQEINEKVTRILKAKEKITSTQPPFFKKEMLITPYAQKLKKQLYQAAVTIVHDRPSHIPVRRDKPLNVITFGNADTFLETLRHHYNIIHNGYELDVSEDSITDVDFHHCIISVHLENPSGMIEQQSQEINADKMPGYVSYINKHADHVTLVFFGNPYNIKQFKNVPTLILGYENQPEAQHAVANVICGEQTASGILPVTPLSYK